MKLGVLVSGTGTNLQALLDAQARGELAPAEIAVVVSNKPGVAALARAAAAGVPAEVVPHAGRVRGEFEAQLLEVLAARGVEAVVLAGFMRILTAHFLDRFPMRVINTHPSLLPAFPGTDAPAQALAYGVKLAGVSVHFVDHGVDTGPIIAQAAVAVADDDTPHTL
ncbi:MAG TPA: phosphoribosylglycinamide formyltransferase, partial [Kofleriaceae bacterium]